MSSKLLRSFASGLFIATATIGGIYLFGPDEMMQENKEVIVTPSIEEMKEALVENDFVVLTKEEFNDLKEAKETPSVQEKVTYHMVFEIRPGMASQHVAQALKKGKIIEDEQLFLNRLKEKKLEKSLRTGVYDINSEQSIDEIISILTRTN